MKSTGIKQNCTAAGKIRGIELARYPTECETSPGSKSIGADQTACREQTATRGTAFNERQRETQVVEQDQMTDTMGARIPQDPLNGKPTRPSLCPHDVLLGTPLTLDLRRPLTT